jgi:hypothetical protein
MMSCPCGEARIGAFLLTAAFYWMSVVGLSPMLAHVAHLDPAGIGWALLSGAGVICIVTGLTAAFTHDDPIRPGSFIWSAGVITLCGYALLHNWALPDSDYHVMHGFWLSWMASNVVNLWLQLRGSFGRRRPAMAIQELAQPGVPTLRRRRRVRAEWLEEFESYGVDAGHVLPPDIAAALPGRLHDLIEHDDALPELVYEKRGDTFVPVRLPERQRLTLR